MSQEERRCPGERYAINEPICKGRRSRHYPKCKGCNFNDDEVRKSPPGAGADSVPGEIFKAYDIRGKVPGQVNEEVAWKIGYAAAQYLLSRDEAQGENGRALVIGHDMRTTSAPLAKACGEGVMAAGADAVMIGEVETPTVYYAVGTLQPAGGIMITASHNPADYNGFKIAGAGAKPVGEATGLKDIQRLAQSVSSAGGSARGQLREVDIAAGYINHVMSFAENVRPMRLVMDASNGMSSKWTPAILEKLGVEVVPLFFERTGDFVHEPNPLRDANIADLRQMVVQDQTRFGVCFDGDADRCVLVDENGDRVGGDTLTALLAGHFVAREPGADIVYDLRSSWAVRETVEQCGGVPRRERVGHSFMKAALRKYNAPFGGELSGHFYYRDNFFCDSGAITLMKVLSALSTSEQPFSEILQPFRKYHSTGEINFRVQDKDALIQQLARKFSDGKVDFLDGVTVEYDDWWFNCRKSNTEPLLRLLVEARSERVLEEKLSRLQSILGTPVHE